MAPTKRSNKDHHPQALVARFWSKFHHKTPGKVTSIFPQSLYKELNPDLISSPSRVRNAAQSYQEARAKCLDMVRAAVTHCESTNAKFCDPDFDVESDFLWGENNCLQGLERCTCAEKTTADTGDATAGQETGGVTECTCPPKARPRAVHRIPWIFENPRFTVDGFSGSDIKQGVVGDCWWLVGVGNIAHRQDLMEKICVARDEDCGVYGFVFFKDGEWIPTIVDDNLFLHTEDYGMGNDVYDKTGKKSKLWRKRYQTGSEALFFSRCDDENETWLPLLEKAYAKVHGDYEAIEGGWAGTAVEDLTGGVASTIEGNRVLRIEKLWRELLGVDGDKTEFVFGLSAAGDAEVSKRNGLALNHAYAITKAVEVEDADGRKVKLVKIRNPWGQGADAGMGEWTGPWSDGSKEWTPELIKKLRHSFGDDGLFWMSLEDMLENFKWIHRTRLFDERWTVAQRWTSTPVSWMPGYIKTKFSFEIQEEGLVVIVLSQLDERYFVGLDGPYGFTMEFIVRAKDSTATVAEARVSSSVLDNRSISCEVHLKPGTYEVLPKIVAERRSWRKPVDEVIKEYANSNPKKLRQLGQLYDIAHARKGVLNEEEAHTKKKKAEILSKKDQQIKDLKEAMEKMQLAMSQMQVGLTAETKAKTKGAEVKEGKEEKVAKSEEASGQSSTEKADTTSDGKKDKDNSAPRAEQAKASPAPPAKEAEVIGESKAADDGEKKEKAQEEAKEAVTSTEEAEEGKEETSGQDSEAVEDEDDADPDDGDDNKLPWNPVCVMCLSVYAQDKSVSVKLAEKEDGKEVAKKEGEK